MVSQPLPKENTLKRIATVGVKRGAESIEVDQKRCEKRKQMASIKTVSLMLALNDQRRIKGRRDSPSKMIPTCFHGGDKLTANEPNPLRLNRLGNSLAVFTETPSFSTRRSPS